MFPCLFNLVTVDPENMLKAGEGIKVGPQKVNGLYYADDNVFLQCS